MSVTFVRSALMVPGKAPKRMIEKIRREIVGGALPKELATGAEGLFVPGETRDRIWLKIR